MERFAKDLHDSVAQKTNTILLSWGGSKSALFFVLPYFFLKSFWLLLTNRIDIVHAQDGVVSIVMFPLSMIFKKPLVVVIHGLDATYKSKLYQSLIKWSLSRADKIICISGAAKAEILKRGFDDTKVQVIPLGITDDLHGDKRNARELVRQFVPKYSGNQKIIITSGRLVERKGVDWFIKNVLPGVLKQQPETLLLVSGEGPWRERIQESIDQSAMNEHVVLFGRTSDEQLKILYNGADCFVMPNVVVDGDMEGFGRVLLEAALCETPVVASGIEGIVDAIVDGKNGTLVQERETEEFIRVILEILQNPKLAQEQGKQARIFTLENYNWSTIAERYIKVYSELEGPKS
ncbi:MAG: phosphatidyl-myo-inositol dimannoside synthase [Patescibacteria group bacterium]|nr:phosphatidyl-myo-inositol dimannoside synthase [Patescibacteria group bacterium]